MPGKEMNGGKENDHGATNSKLANVEEVREPVLFTLKVMKWNNEWIVFLLKQGCHEAGDTLTSQSKVIIKSS